MKIIFNLNYATQWGEALYVCGTIPELGNNDVHLAKEMQLIGEGKWSLEIEGDHIPAEFDYFFILKPEAGEWRFEWGDPHKFLASGNAARVDIFASWEDMPGDKPFYSSAFVDGILHRAEKDAREPWKADTLVMRVAAPMVGPGQMVAVSGSCPALGEWDVTKAARMNDAEYPVWQAEIPFSQIDGDFEYKFLVVNKHDGSVAAWENRDNRKFGIEIEKGKGNTLVIDGLRIANPFTSWHGAGTAIPVFSLRTEKDFGVGDFEDLRLMVDWCKLTGQTVLQILPINDTTLTGTWLDSYPYRANSTFALHPMFLRVEKVGVFADEGRNKYFEGLREEFNSFPEVDYERVMRAKDAYLREIYQEQGHGLAAEPAYQEFVKKNDYWLRPYAAWSVLRDLHNTPDNVEWGEYAQYDKEKVDKFVESHFDEVGYYYFLQYHLDKQLREVVDYARDNHVVLKGDIPIGIGRHSVDAWLYPNLFNMNSQAGAPPDDFSVLGQNWGFPTYNWDEMAKDGFAWWKARFMKMAEYFDAYRIDHILGFFRIWQIPIDALHGLLGVFNPALPFTVDELRNDYDFWLNVDFQTQPMILEWMLGDFFGEYAQEAKERFLEHVGGDRFRLKQFVATQKRVADYFATQEKNDKNDRLCNALLGLIDDVLFIEDPYERGKYHPRISAQHTYQYRVLSDYEKWCFNRLYNDFFYRRHNDFWYGKAMWKLPPLLDSTRMLACAEDLGMIPDCVPAVMERLEILSLEIQRMPKDPKKEFGEPWHYPYYSVCTTSTHDMGGIRSWWESDRAMAQRFYNNVLHEHGEAPHFAEPWICNKIIDQHLYSPSMLCILPLQDWLSTDGVIRRQNPHEEQINVPANPTHYWRYRMHLTVEKLLGERVFNEELTSKIRHSGR